MPNQRSKSKPIPCLATLCLLVGFVLATLGGVFVPRKASPNFAPGETNLLAGFTLQASAFAPLDRSDTRLKSKTGRRQTAPSLALCATVPVFARSVSGNPPFQNCELYGGSPNTSLPRDRAPPTFILPADC
jgi:hypothetical protein